MFGIRTIKRENQRLKQRVENQHTLLLKFSKDRLDKSEEIKELRKSVKGVTAKQVANGIRKITPAGLVGIGLISLVVGAALYYSNYSNMESD